MKEASQHILEVFGGIGSPALECVCGREHCAPDSQYIESDEAERMRARARDKPNRTILYDGDDGISAKIINGATVVPGCPCEFIPKLEALLWNEREQILTYYKLRRDADRDALSKLDEAIRNTSTVTEVRRG